MSIPKATSWTRGVRRGGTLAVTVLVIATPPAGAATAVYGGTTSLGRNPQEAFVLRSDAKANKVRSVVLSWQAECTDGGTLPYSSQLPVSTGTPGFGDPEDTLVAKRNAKGRLAGRATSSGTLSDGSSLTVETSLTGRISKRTGKGTMSATAVISPPGGAPQITCAQSGIRWVASRNPGRIYGGATAQSEPVVVRLNAARTVIADLIFGWDSIKCTPDSFFRLGDWLNTFEVRGGRFGDAFEQRYKRDDGGESIYTYDIAGTVSKRTASGRFSVNWNRTFTDGTTPNRSCETGTVTWRATTG
jgi:hypothetical protein